MHMCFAGAFHFAPQVSLGPSSDDEGMRSDHPPNECHHLRAKSSRTRVGFDSATRWRHPVRLHRWYGSSPPAATTVLLDLARRVGPVSPRWSTSEDRVWAEAFLGLLR